METRNVSAAERRERFCFNGVGRYEARRPVNGREVPFLFIFACAKKAILKIRYRNIDITETNRKK